MTENKLSSNIQTIMSLGFWTSIITTVLVIFSGITATIAVKIPSLISGILLVPAFTVLMVCFYEYAPPERKIYGLIGIVFTLGYTVLIGFNYFMQLTLVRQNLYAVEFAMDNPKSVMWVIEVLGYGFMGLATLFASWVFKSGKLETAIRWLFIINGILGIGGMIGYAAGLNIDVLWGGLIAWDIVMPASSILLAILFKKVQLSNK